MSWDVDEELALLPEEDHVQFLKEIVHMLIGADQERLRQYRLRFGLTGVPAKVLNFLVLKAPWLCSKDAIHEALYGPDSDRQVKNMHAAIHRARRAIAPDFKIHLNVGYGYWIDRAHARKLHALTTPGSLEIPLKSSPCKDGVVLPHHQSGWEKDDDLILLRMVKLEQPCTAIALRLGRTERAVKGRLKFIFGTESVKKAKAKIDELGKARA